MAKEKEWNGGERNKTSSVGVPCPGSICAFNHQILGEHRSPNLWPPCWKCGQPLGCRKCTVSDETEVLCESCLAWGTVAAFCLHGPITNNPIQLRKRFGRRAPQWQDYPQAWCAAFPRSERDFREGIQAGMENLTRGQVPSRAMLDVFSAAVPTAYAALILDAWAQREDAQETI